jgi:hypothetical protein
MIVNCKQDEKKLLYVSSTNSWVCIVWISYPLKKNKSENEIKT